MKPPGNVSTNEGFKSTYEDMFFVVETHHMRLAHEGI